MNLLRLLLEPRGFLLRHFSDIPAIAHGLRREPLAGLIIDCRALLKGFNQALDLLCDHRQIVRLPKIFLCQCVSREEKLTEKLQLMAGALVVFKPFSPESLVEHAVKHFGVEPRRAA